MKIDTNRRFWARIVAQAVLVNLPLAWMVASGGLSLAAGALCSVAVGALTLVIWDGTRTTESAFESLLNEADARSDARRVPAGLRQLHEVNAA